MLDVADGQKQRGLTYLKVPWGPTESVLLQYLPSMLPANVPAVLAQLQMVITVSEYGNLNSQFDLL